MLEGIGRQCRTTVRVGLIEYLPIDVETATIELAEAREDLVQLAPIAERAEPCLLASLHILLPEREQGIARPYFNQIGSAGLDQRTHSVGKTYSIKRVVTPVPRIRWFLHWHRGDGRYPRDFRRLGLHGGSDATELVHGRPHQWRMKGVGNSQKSAANTETFKMRNEGSHSVARARDNRVLRPIQRCDRNIRTVKLPNCRRHSLSIREYSGQRADLRQILHETRTL